MSDHSPHVILVLGMHRSGTSAATRVLQLLGFDLGRRLMPPMPDSNEKGFWENLDAVDIDDRLLVGLGRSWHDVRTLPAGWLQSAAANEAKAAIKSLVQADFETAPCWAVKDPRMCRLAPLWLEALAELGIEPRILFVARDPHEVAASLFARDGWPHARSRILWLQHVLEAERATRTCRRAMVTYDQLLQDWPRSIGRVSDALGLTWPRSLDDAKAEIDGFLDAGARHHERPAPPTGTPADASALVDEVFAQCVQASTSDSAWRSLGASADQFDRFSSLYGACLDDFIGFATRSTGRVQHAATVPSHARPEPIAIEGADAGGITPSLRLYAALLERLGHAADAQWARIASLESLLFAEHQSLRAVLSGESHRIRSTVTAEAQRAREETEKLARLVAGQAETIRTLQEELGRVRRGLFLPTLSRWLGRSDA